MAHTANKRNMRNALRFPPPGGLLPWLGIIDGRTGDGNGESIRGTNKLFFEVSAGECAAVRRRDILGGFCRDEMIIFGSVDNDDRRPPCNVESQLSLFTYV